MTAQYLRKTKLIVGNSVGALDLSDMQFSFRVERGDIQTPNTCSVRVYNLKKETVNRLKAGEFTNMVLSGGYEGNEGIAFTGTVKYVYNGNETAVDRYLDIVAADGDEAYNFAVVNKTLAAGSNGGDHINVAASSFAEYDVTFDTSQNPTIAPQGLPRGKVFYGLARDTMRKACANYGLTWGIQDGALGLVLKTSYRPGAPIVLTSATGLIGFPQQTQNGIIIKSLFNPAIKISGTLKIDNASIQGFRFGVSIDSAPANLLVPSIDSDGMYKVLYTQHTGDTRANEYYTESTCISVDPTALLPPSVVSRLSPASGNGPVNPYLGP